MLFLFLVLVDCKREFGDICSIFDMLNALIPNARSLGYTVCDPDPMIHDVIINLYDYILNEGGTKGENLETLINLLTVFDQELQRLIRIYHRRVEIYKEKIREKAHEMRFRSEFD